MTTPEIIVGDRVVAKYGTTMNSAIYGVHGTVKHISGEECAIEFDKDIGGHDCSGHAEDGHGWWLLMDDLELADIGEIYDDASVEELYEMSYEELMA